MKTKLLRVAAASPALRVGAISENARRIVEAVQRADGMGIKVLVFPELALTGATCGDMFFQSGFAERAEEALCDITQATVENDVLFCVGLPRRDGMGALRNACAVLYRGERIAIAESRAHSRHFAPREGKPRIIECPHFRMGVVFGDDLSDAAELAAAGATILLNPTAFPETMHSRDAQSLLLKANSMQLCAAYVSANPGGGESSGDAVYTGKCAVVESGEILCEGKSFVSAEIDLGHLDGDRAKRRFYTPNASSLDCDRFVPQGDWGARCITRAVDPDPFLPKDAVALSRALTLQAKALAGRLSHIGCEKLILGVSGGLDSTLALLVCERTLAMAGLPAANCIAVTMPCFGTSGRTYKNACAMAKALGATLREIDIKQSVLQHFRDIAPEEDLLSAHGVVYENAQARERTQVLMDLANKENALMVGPGDLSELALGFTTYNGDHMSMYGVNASVPKTLVREIVNAYADETANVPLKTALKDVLDTPVSPELLPTAQPTEEIVGPYRLHDFFLYYFIRRNASPETILLYAEKAFEGIYDGEIILKWLRVFLRRFPRAQFKRSCMPDGAKVTEVSLSPRGDWVLPSDAAFDEILRPE
ncbi:MAG: NAD(+) synthase [Christensenellales bacterium]|jgi:NAD+ synthase (glutamine-hydrolysing)